MIHYIHRDQRLGGAVEGEPETLSASKTMDLERAEAFIQCIHLVLCKIEVQGSGFRGVLHLH